MRLYRRGVTSQLPSQEQQDIDQMFNCLWNWRYPMGVSPRIPWQPPLDVFETNDALVVEMEVAGVREEDLEIVVSDRALLVAGDREDRRRCDKVTYHQLGISYGSFQTQVLFPTSVDVDAVEATYENGFLSIVLPKIKPVQVEAKRANNAIPKDAVEGQ